MSEQVQPAASGILKLDKSAEQVIREARGHCDEKDAQIAALAAERDALENQVRAQNETIQMLQTGLDREAKAYDAAQADAQALADALKTFGWHVGACEFYTGGDCSCGFADAKTHGAKYLETAK